MWPLATEYYYTEYVCIEELLYSNKHKSILIYLYICIYMYIYTLGCWKPSVVATLLGGISYQATTQQSFLKGGNIYE